MDVHAARGDGRTVRRLIALLVALAVLAERVADRSLPVRCFVLWILRRAETIAKEFVLEATGSPPAPEAIAASGHGPADALSLAARFRALAAALGVLLPVGSGLRSGCRHVRRGFAWCPIAARFRLRPGGWTREPHDTS